MNKKKLLKRIGLLFVSILILLAIIPFFIPESVIRPKLIAQIESVTGKHLVINGSLRFFFIPSAGMHVEGVVLSSPASKDAPEEVIFQTKAMDIKIDTASLILNGNLKVLGFTLMEPKILLHITKDGSANWQPQVASAPVVAPAASKPAQAEEAALPHNTLQYAKVDIEKGAFTYLNDATSDRWDAENLDAQLSLSGLSEPLTAKASMQLNHKKFSFDGKLTTLQSFLHDDRVQVDAKIASEVMDATLKGMVTNRNYIGEVAIKTDSIKNLMAWSMPNAPPLADTTPSELSVAGQLDCNPSHCNLTKSQLAVDKIKATGSIMLALSRSSRPELDIDLTTNVLDLTAFMPAKTALNSNGYFVSDALAEASRWSDAPIDLSALNQINGSVNLRAEGAKMNNLTVGKMLIQAKLQRGRLGIDIIDAALYDGKATILSTVDANDATLTSHIKLLGVNAEKLLKDMSGSDQLSGKLNTDMNLATRGHSEKEMVSALSGTGVIHVENGAVKGYNLAEIVRNIKSTFTPTKQTSQQTDFSELGGTFAINQGIITNQNLAMKAPLLRLSGNGQVDLPAYTINYRLTPQLVDTLKGQGGAEKQGIGVPVIVQGSLDNPTFTPDLKSVIQDAIKDPQKFKDAVKSPQVKETVKSLKGLLKGL